MKHLTITRLSLAGFKGQARQLDFRGESAAIYGPNGAGKTTIADAVAWALTGKDSQGRQPGRGFSILTAVDRDLPPAETQSYTDQPGTLSAEVEIEFPGHPSGVAPEVAPGGVLILRKAYRALVGDDGNVMGNTVDHWIDGVPVKAGEYVAEVASICEPELWASAADPIFFAETLAWKRRRELVMEMAGKVTAEELIEAAPELAELIASGEPIDRVRRRAASDKAAAVKALDQVPTRISEAARALDEEPPAMSADEVAAEVERLKADRRVTLADMERIRQGGQVAALRKDLAEIEAEIQRAATEHKRQEDERLDGLRKALSDAKMVTREAGAAAKEALDNGASVERKSTALAAEAGALEAKRDAVPVFEAEDTCSACGQAIPPEMRGELQAAMNRERAIVLEELAARLAATVEALASARQELADHAKAFEVRHLAFKTAKTNELAAEAAVRDFEPAPFEWPDLEKRYRDLLAKIEALTVDSSPELDVKAADLTAIDKAIGDAEAVGMIHRQRAHAHKRVGELRAEAAQHRADLGAAEALLRLCDLRDETLAHLLGGRAGKLAEIFGDTVRFQLFRRQVNGDFEERCDVTSPDGRRFTGELSGGERIQAGLAICRGVQKWLGFCPPVIIDESESLTSPVEMPGQVIRLVASSDYQDLTLERG